MTGRDPQERAKSSDRDAAMDLIERAHAEGRIGSADRTIRKNNIATAATIGEIGMILRDLASRPADSVPDDPAAVYDEPTAAAYEEPLAAVGEQPAPAFEQPPEPAAYNLPPQAYMTRSVVVHRRSCAPVLLAWVAVLIGVAIAGSVFFTTTGLPGIDLGESDPSVQAVDDQYALDEEGFLWMLGRYRSEFGTTEALRAVFYDGYAIFDVPDDEGRAEHTGWIYRAGGFTEMSGAQVNAADAVAVNLKRVDYTALDASLDLALRTLNVEGGTVSHVILGHDPFEERVTASVYVSNTVGASGFLVTDLRGKVLRSFPYGG